MLNKKLIAGAIFALALTVSFTASAATATLRKGSKGEDVKTLQTALKLTADGKFGAMTQAAVKAFQKTNGLTADGVVGPKTWAAITGTTATTTTTTTTTTTPVVTTVGAAGNANITDTTTDTETTVSGGDSEKVLAFKVEGDGSDLSVKNVKVTLTNINAGSSKRIERYFESFDVYAGSTKVASADVADFSKDGEVYTKNFNLDNAVVTKGSSNKVTFWVKANAKSTIDSADSANTWTIKASDVRYTDGTGIILSSSTLIPSLSTIPSGVRTFTVKKLSSSGDVKLNITKGSASPVAQNVKVSDTGSTSDVLMNQFKLKATGTKMTVSKVTLTATGTGATVGEIASELSVKVAGQTATAKETLGANGDYTFNFDEDVVIAQDSTVTFEVFAKINKIAASGSNFGQGDSLNISYKGATVEDINGDAVTTSNGASISGSSIGEAQTFYSNGLNASGFTSSVASTVNQNGVTTKNTYTASFNLTAFGNTYYIPKGVEKSAGLSAASTNGLSYVIESSTGSAPTGHEYDNVAVGSSASSLSSSASTVGSYFEIPDGETKTFTVTVEIVPGTAPVSGFYHVQLGSVLYDLDQTAGSASVYTFAPAQNFETADRSI